MAAEGIFGSWPDEESDMGVGVLECWVVLGTGEEPSAFCAEDADKEDGDTAAG